MKRIRVELGDATNLLMEEALKKLLRVTKAAHAGDGSCIDVLRLLGESLLIGGGIDAMREVQGQLHDYAVVHHRAGSLGSSIGCFWEHIREWNDA